MFGWFRSDPAKKVQKELARAQEAAMLLQRKGDMRGFAEKTAEAEALIKKLESLKPASP